MTTWARYRVIVVVAAAIIVTDQITKDWASGLGTRVIPLVGSLQFRLAHNTGMAFSNGQGLGAIIAALAVVIVGVMIWLARSVDSTVARFAIGLVIGGALGNVADRIFRAGLVGQSRGFLGGAVVDFIDLQWFPSFNVADACITVGGIVVALFVGREEQTDTVDGPTTSEASAEASARTDG